MNLKTAYIFIFIILLGAILTFFYFRYSNQPSEKFINLTISAKEGKNLIKTGYVIESIDGIKKGNTSQTYRLDKVRYGQFFTIYNENLEDQLYFQDKRTLNASKEPFRIDLKLEKPKEIKTTILNTDPIVLQIESEDARNISFCLKSSQNYLFVKTNFTKTGKLKGYENWDECYLTDFNLKNTKEIININYTKFSSPTEKDYINISLIQNQFLGKLDKNKKLI